MTDLFRESINDKNLFKAVFMAGGPGSGKSFMANNLFSFDKNTIYSYTGAMLVNSDNLFERMLKSAGLPMKMDASGDQDLYGKQMSVRTRAKDLTNSRQSNYINGMLPLVIDGTGKDFDKISKQAIALRKIGYDTSMVFVNTSLETSLRRNDARERSVDKELVSRTWYQVQSNIGKFQEFFEPENFIVIDSNVDYQKGSKEYEELMNRLYNLGNKLLNKPLSNPKGIKTLEYLKATGGKYLSDIPSDIKDLKESCKKALGYVPWSLVNTL